MTESFPTLATFEWFLAAMETAVLGQVVLVFERLAADLTAERALACNIIIIIYNGRLAADLTAERALA